MQSNGGQELGLQSDGYQHDGGTGNISPTCQPDNTGNKVPVYQEGGTGSKDPAHQPDGAGCIGTGYQLDGTRSKRHLYKRKAILHTRGGQFERITIAKVLEQVDEVRYQHLIKTNFRSQLHCVVSGFFPACY